jgi:hypothetical protein
MLFFFCKNQFYSWEEGFEKSTCHFYYVSAQVHHSVQVTGVSLLWQHIQNHTFSHHLWSNSYSFKSKRKRHADMFPKVWTVLSMGMRVLAQVRFGGDQVPRDGNFRVFFSNMFWVLGGGGSLKDLHMISSADSPHCK